MITHPQCFDCKHLHRNADDFSCDAFPDHIPGRILLNKVDHELPYPGDHGIRFELREDLVEEKAAEEKAAAERAAEAAARGSGPRWLKFLRRRKSQQ